MVTLSVGRHLILNFPHIFDNHGITSYQRAIPRDLRHRFRGLTKITVKLEGTSSSIALEAARLAAHHDRLFKMLRGKGAEDLGAQQLDAYLLLEHFDLQPGAGQAYVKDHQGQDAQPHLEFIEDYLKGKEENGTLTPSDRLARKALQAPLPLLLSQAPEVYFSEHRRGTEAAFKQGVLLNWRKLIEITGDIPITGLTRDLAKRYITERAGVVKTASVKREINSLRAVLTTVIREGGLQMNNPFVALTIPGEGKDSVRRLRFTDEELRTVIRSSLAVGDEIRVLALLCCLTGARIGEVTGLRRQDLFLDGAYPYLQIAEYGRRTVKNKNSARRVPVVAIGVRAMKTLLQSTKSEQLFPRYCDGVTANADNASAAVNKYIRALGIKARTAHCARHAMRDLLRHANVTIDVMNEIGGWGSQSIADRYGEGHDLKTKTEAITRALAPVLDTL